MERQRQAERVRRRPQLPFQNGRSLTRDEEGGTPSPAYGVGCPLAPQARPHASRTQAGQAGCWLQGCVNVLPASRFMGRTDEGFAAPAEASPPQRHQLLALRVPTHRDPGPAICS